MPAVGRTTGLRGTAGGLVRHLASRTGSRSEEELGRNGRAPPGLEGAGISLDVVEGVAPLRSTVDDMLDAAARPGLPVASLAASRARSLTRLSSLRRIGTLRSGHDLVRVRRIEIDPHGLGAAIPRLLSRAAVVPLSCSRSEPGHRAEGTDEYYQFPIGRGALAISARQPCNPRNTGTS